jgi:hypothetical protein
MVGQPLAQTGRQHELLLAVAFDEVLRHGRPPEIEDDRILLGSSDENTPANRGLCDSLSAGICAPHLGLGSTITTGDPDFVVCAGPGFTGHLGEQLSSILHEREQVLAGFERRAVAVALDQPLGL